MTLYERAKQFANGAVVITEWLGSGGKTVPPEQAQKRADVCIKCPLNVKESKITEAMASAIRTQLGLKNKLGIRVQGEKKLLGCSACGCDIKLKVHVPLEYIKPTPEELVAFDIDCWLHREIET